VGVKNFLPDSPRFQLNSEAGPARALFETMLSENHYLADQGILGENMKYLVRVMANRLGHGEDIPELHGVFAVTA